MRKMHARFPRGIEVVGGVVIEDKNGEILLVRSPKWGGKWVLPGGHVEPGEKIMDAQAREGQEETGLRLKPIAVFQWGEIIGPKDFHRQGHFVYFDVHCRALSKNVKLQKEELSDYAWVTPKKALSMHLADTYRETLEGFIRYKKSR